MAIQSEQLKGKATEIRTHLCPFLWKSAQSFAELKRRHGVLDPVVIVCFQTGLFKLAECRWSRWAEWLWPTYSQRCIWRWNWRCYWIFTNGNALFWSISFTVGQFFLFLFFSTFWNSICGLRNSIFRALWDSICCVFWNSVSCALLNSICCALLDAIYCIFQITIRYDLLSVVQRAFVVTIIWLFWRWKVPGRGLGCTVCIWSKKSLCAWWFLSLWLDHVVLFLHNNRSVWLVTAIRLNRFEC